MPFGRGMLCRGNLGLQKLLCRSLKISTATCLAFLCELINQTIKNLLSLLFVIHCGIRTKQEMELLPCDLTSCYLCQLFTDLRRGKTYFIIIISIFILFFRIYYLIYFLIYFLLINLIFKHLTCWLVSNQLINFFELS